MSWNDTVALIEEKGWSNCALDIAAKNELAEQAHKEAVARLHQAQNMLHTQQSRAEDMIIYAAKHNPEVLVNEGWFADGSGEIYVMRVLDAETTNVYEFRITGYDKHGHPIVKISKLPITVFSP